MEKWEYAIVKAGNEIGAPAVDGGVDQSEQIYGYAVVKGNQLTVVAALDLIIFPAFCCCAFCAY